jgi:hypothetical protein
MRVMQLRVEVVRGEVSKELEVKSFARIIGADGEPAPPWLAKTEVMNNAIQADEKRVVSYDYALQEGDVVKAELGYYLVNPKMLKQLDLEKSEVATKFKSYKVERFEINE